MKVFFVLLIMLSLFTHAQVVDKIIAIVNDEVITQSDLASFKKRLSKGKFVDDTLIKDKASVLKSEKSLLDALIDERIIDSEIKKQDLSITIERADQEIRRVAERNNLSKTLLFDELKKQGVSASEYQNFMKQRLERESLVQKAISSKIRISEEEIQNYYLNQFSNKKLSAYELTLSHILFRPKDGDKEAAKLRADAVYEKLRSGQNFEALASQYSEDPNFAQGGYLGAFKNGEFLKELEVAAMNLQPGQTSSVVSSKLGYHILKLISKKITKDPEYESKKKDIQNILYEKAFSQQFKFWIEQKRQESFIKINS